MRISDWSSDVCSSDLGEHGAVVEHERRDIAFGGDRAIIRAVGRNLGLEIDALVIERQPGFVRSEEHTSELQSLMRISYAVFCLKKKKKIVKNMTQKSTTIKRYKAI